MSNNNAEKSREIVPETTEPEAEQYADEHEVFLNFLQYYDEAKLRREKYEKYGPLVVLVSGVVFLSLMFTLDRKIDFLILWVVTALVIAALMIRTEYVYHRCRVILGIIKDDEEDEEEEDAEEEEDVNEEKSVNEEENKEENENREEDKEKNGEEPQQ